MPILRTIVMSLFVFFTVQALGQTSVQILIIGKWLLTKHTVLENGMQVNKLTQDDIVTYEFAKNGSYTVIFKNKKLGTTVNKGKWKIIKNGKKIRLYETSDVPDDPKILIADHDLNVVKITSTEFVTEEYLFDEGSAGKSYYKKQR